MENNDWTIGDHLEDWNNPHHVTKEQVGLGNVENVRQYSAVNPPPNHINTVCGKSPDANGDIDLLKGDVNLGKVDNVKQYSQKNPPPYPVTSVNGKTGAVVIPSGDSEALTAHTGDKANPHGVTKAQVGLGSVPDVLPYHPGNKPTKCDVGLSNLDDVRQYSALNPPPYPVTSVNGKTGNVSLELPDVSGLEAAVSSHTGNKANPHGVTKAQVGLGNVDNTGDLQKPVSTATQAALSGKLDKSGGVVTGETNFTGGLKKAGEEVAAYETGSFHPQLMRLENGVLYSLNGCAIKYQFGNYTKIGDLVFVSAHICYDLSQNQIGDAVIKLPFKAAVVGKQALSIGTIYDALNTIEDQDIGWNTGVLAYIDGTDYILFKYPSSGAAATRWKRTTDKTWFSQVCVTGVYKIG